MKKGCVILIEKCFESEQKNSKGEVLHDCNVPKIIDGDVGSKGCRGVSGGWADFGRIEGHAGRRRQLRYHALHYYLPKFDCTFEVYF